MLSRPEDMFQSMAERELRARESFGHQHCLMSNATERQDHADLAELTKLELEVSVAAADLIRQRLVCRRHAFDRIGDARVPQLEPVIRGYGFGTCRKPELVQRLV